MRHFTKTILALFIMNMAMAQTEFRMRSTNDLFNKFDGNSSNTVGKQNPAAPQALRQFDFMIGEFECHDSLLINGAWQTSWAIWQSRYTLNGYAIEDQYRKDNYAGMSIRVFDPIKKKWAVHFFGMPGNHQGVWYGEKIGDRMVMRQKRIAKNGSAMESRLTFYDISEEAFKWKGELVDLSTGTSTVNWKILATRKK